jgi:predicted nuclease of predicted toxin-antitoxin system
MEPGPAWYTSVQYTIFTKDADFSDVNVLRGFPPKVIWIRLGNCATSDLENALRQGDALPDMTRIGREAN